MTTGQWLLLTDYASKYRISVSTLRRRIKNETIQFRFDAGKYYIYDAPPKAVENQPVTDNLSFPGIRPSAVQTVPLSQSIARESAQRPYETLKADLNSHEPSQPLFQEMTTQSAQAGNATDEPIISAATRLLNELKRAYMNILHEKEEQIIQLKEEVTDLKMLVRVLEDDNERMRKILSQPLNAPTIHE